MKTQSLTAEDHKHTALVDELVSVIEPFIAVHHPTVHSAVLATLLARFLSTCPVPSLRPVILRETLALMNALIELYDLQALGRETN